MFRYCLKAPLKLLSLNARQHSLINSRCADNALAALKRDKWTCCKCGTQLNEMMDVHHTGRTSRPKRATWQRSVSSVMTASIQSGLPLNADGFRSMLPSGPRSP